MTLSTILEARWFGAPAFAALLLVVACGDTGTTEATVLSGAAPATTQPELSPSPATVEPSAPTTTTESPAVTQTPVPPVVGSFAAWVGAGGGDECFHGGPEPFVGLPEGETRAVVGRFEPLCFIGFDPDQAIEVTFTLPDGSRASTLFQGGPGGEDIRPPIDPTDPLVSPVSDDAFLCEEGGPSVCTFSWLIRPHYQLGGYAIEARQGGTVALGELEVIDRIPAAEALGFPPEPYVQAVSKWYTVPRGHKVSFVLSGFDSGQLVPLAFYTPTDETFIEDDVTKGVYVLHSEVGVVEVDDRGNAMFQADSSTFAPGSYCLATPLDPNPACGSIGGSFTVN